MKPLEIRIALMKEGIRPTDIAGFLGVSTSAVLHTINRKSVSDRIQRAVSKAIRKPVDQVFPDRYLSRPRPDVVRERLAG